MEGALKNHGFFLRKGGWFPRIFKDLHGSNGCFKDLFCKIFEVQTIVLVDFFSPGETKLGFKNRGHMLVLHEQI
jgi:hypothetical protein